MAWTTPVTDRTSGAYCTVTDMNRIANNLDWVTHIANAFGLYSGTMIDKITYTTDDYISVSDWSNILAVIADLVDAFSYEVDGHPDDSMTYTNFNTVESLTSDLYEWVRLLIRQSDSNHYTGDDIYSAGAISIYSAGAN